MRRALLLIALLAAAPRAALAQQGQQGEAGQAGEAGEEEEEERDQAPPADELPPKPQPTRRAEVEPGWSRGWAYESFDPPAWGRKQHAAPLARLWLAPTVARLSSEALTLVGASAAFGFESQHAVSPTFNKFFYGSSFGLELRGHALRTVAGARSSWLLAGGIALTLNVTEVGRYGASRVRFPSLFGLITPEAGVAARHPQPTSFYLRWSAPVAVLVEKRVAIELVPAVSLLYQGAGGGIETMWSLGLGVSWRALGRPMRLV